MPAHSYISPISLLNIPPPTVEQTMECPICADSMEGHNRHSLAPCQHQFHAGCIIQWFRDGNSSCPLCRQHHFVFREQVNGRAIYDKLTNFEKTAFRKYIKTKKPNRIVVLLFQKYLNAEKERAAWRKELKTFKKTNKDMIKQYEKLRNKRWPLNSKMRRIVHSLHSIPIVPFVVHIRRNERARRAPNAAAEEQSVPEAEVEQPEVEDPQLPSTLENLLQDVDVSDSDSPSDSESDISTSDSSSFSEDEDEDD
jgi:hypothetical protein